MNEPVLQRLQQLMTIREGVENLGVPALWVPAADWLDEDTHLLLVMDVPGIDADSLALHEEGNSVTVTGERQLSGRTIHSERARGTFSRTFTFPDEVVAQSGEAQLAAGVLCVRFEKVHPTINVSSDEVNVQDD